MINRIARGYMLHVTRSLYVIDKQTEEPLLEQIIRTEAGKL